MWGRPGAAGYSLRRVITGDLDRALATPVSSAGTWRPAPPGSGAAPGTYATTIAFLLARRGSADAPAVAAALAARLRELEWVSAVAVTGGGYLTVTVTPDTLARLAVRVTQAGSRSCRSDALAGMAVTAPAAVDLVSAPSWAEARRRLAATVLGRLAEAAGAQVTWIHDAERMAVPNSPAHTGASRRPGHEKAADGAAGGGEPGGGEPGGGEAGREDDARPVAGAGPVAQAIGFAGTGPVIYALACLPPRGAVRLDAGLIAAHDLGNPAYAVRYAHAHAASILRQAADLGLALGEAAEFQPRLLAHPSEQALLRELSWLPERVAQAARRGRLDVLARFLEGLAGAYLACQETCPAVRPGEAQDGWSSSVAVGGTPDGGPPGAAARLPGDPAGSPVTVARLWLAAAARTALRAGLDLLGVDAPDRM